MLIYAIDDEIAPLKLLAQEIKKALPDAVIKTYQEQEELIEDFRRQKADVVFLDVEMPERNGISLAKLLLEINPEINFVFVTGYNEYALDALKVYASGYIMKPVTKEEILKTIMHLRYPVVEKQVEIRTFGTFEVFIENRPVKFRLQKSKMLLAYLIECEGRTMNRKDISHAIYEDDEYSRSRQRDLCRLAQWLQEDLAKAWTNPDDSVKVFVSDNGYRIDTSKVKCDLYDFLRDQDSVEYHGEYMEQYNFAAERRKALSKYAKKGKRKIISKN